MKTWWYHLNLNPMPWRVGPVSAYRSADTKKVAGKVGRDQELDAFKRGVADELRLMNPIKVEGKFALTIYLWRNIEEYKTTQARVARNQEADGTNMLKAIEDACQGVLYDNDKDNVDGHFYVVEQGPDVTSRIIIRLQESHPVAVQVAVKTQLPDELYIAVYGTASEQLAMELARPKTELAKENDRYGQADVDF